MKINFKLGIVVCALCAFFLCCDKPHDLLTGRVLSKYTLTVDSLEQFGLSGYDAGLKAIVIPCNNNHTLRIYVSDSTDLKPGSEHSMFIVSFQNAGHLKKNECYLEVTTSVNDTYLSLATNAFYWDNRVNTGNPVARLDHIKLQHFTSTIQNDVTYLSATLEPYPQ